MPRVRLLLIEDEAIVRLLAADELREQGFLVEEAGTAREALAQLDDGPDGFAAAIVDLGLPDARGEELIAEIRRRAPGLAILVASGLDEDEVRRRLGGSVALLRKPYEVSTLRRALAGLIDGPARATAAA